MERAARRFLTPVAAAFFLAMTVPGAGDENPAGAIAAAAGHPSRAHLRAELAAERDGRTVRWTLEVEGNARLERECVEGLCMGTWFDGARTFAFGVNGTPLHAGERDDALERTFTAILSTAFAEPAFLGAGGRVSKLRATDAGEERYAVTAPGGADLVAVADPRTHRLDSVQRGDGTELARLVASAEPAPLIYAARSFGRVAAVQGTLTGPTGPPVTIGAARDLPLEPGSLPLVPCRLAGRDAICLIDSGTTPSAITLGFAERIGAEPHGTIEIGGLGPYLTGVIDAEPLELGGASIGRLHFAVVPHARGADFDVIVGSDLLAGLRVALDSRRRTVEITARGSGSDDAAIAVDFVNGLPFADVRFNDRSHIDSLLVDTGDSGTVSIGYDQLYREPELFAPAGHSVARGIGGPAMDSVDGELSRIAAGSLHFEHIAIAAVRGQHQGHLGYGFALRCGRFVLDLGAGRIGCSPQPDAAEAPRAGQPNTRS